MKFGWGWWGIGSTDREWKRTLLLERGKREK